MFNLLLFFSLVFPRLGQGAVAVRGVPRSEKALSGLSFLSAKKPRKIARAKKVAQAIFPWFVSPDRK